MWLASQSPHAKKGLGLGFIGFRGSAAFLQIMRQSCQVRDFKQGELSKLSADCGI